MNIGKLKHKTIYVGVAALRLALVERGQSLRRVKCFPVVREVRERERLLSSLVFHYFLSVAKAIGRN